MKKILVVGLFIIGISEIASAQRLKKQDKAVIENLRNEIGYLASDKLEGRRTGTPGEKLAYEFIEEQFKNLKLIPKGDDDSYIQTFIINEGKQILPQTHLIINDNKLVSETDFFPFIFSANGSITSDASPALPEQGAPWFLDIKDLLEQNKDNPHFDIEDAIKNKAIDFADKGANAVIVYNSGKADDELKFDGKEKIDPIKIPVIFLTTNAVSKYLNDKTSSYNIKLNIALGKKERTAHNVIGFIDNGAPYTIIIGAHYDHLGYGEDHNSLWTGKPEIHNGADDNASGTAAVIELARMLKNSKLKKNNYLFICFSGEELGLFGSKYFTEHPTVSLSSTNYMINADMVGRLNDSTHTITIGGYGTSREWSHALEQKTKEFSVKFDSSGIGPSDHTSFYLKDIPVLFFFTGIHADYHKPTDDVDKINLPGELYVIKYIYHVIDETNNDGKLAFLKTREPKMEAKRFTVTLGIMPDYTFDGKGVRADGIIDGKIAQKAGMKAGDVIIQLGDNQVTDLNTYMSALSKFKKGDATTVTIVRDKNEMKFDIIF